MNVDDMLLGGSTVRHLKEINQLVKRDAAKFISDQIDFVTKEVNEIVQAAQEHADENENDEYRPDDQRVKTLVDILEAVAVVSQVSGVEYYLPYYDEWGYAPDGSPMSRLLEDAFEDPTSAVDQLASLLEDMEYDVRQWNTSTC